MQIWNKHISAILFNSLVNQGASKRVKMVLTDFKEKSLSRPPAKTFKKNKNML